jgi:hypothetical protein
LWKNLLTNAIIASSYKDSPCAGLLLLHLSFNAPVRQSEQDEGNQITILSEEKMKKLLKLKRNISVFLVMALIFTFVPGLTYAEYDDIESCDLTGVDFAEKTDEKDLTDVEDNDIEDKDIEDTYLTNNDCTEENDEEDSAYDRGNPAALANYDVNVVTPGIEHLTVSTIPTGHVFNGSAQGIGNIVTNTSGISVLDDFTIGYQLNGAGDIVTAAPTNAGTYTVYAVFTETDYVNATDVNLGTYTIAPLNISSGYQLGGAFATMTFNNNQQNPTGSRTVTHPSAPGVNVTGTWSSVRDVGQTTTFTATGNFTGQTAEVNPNMQRLNINDWPFYEYQGAFNPLTYTGLPQNPTGRTITFNGWTVTGDWDSVTNAGWSTLFRSTGNFTGNAGPFNPGMQPFDINTAPGYGFGNDFTSRTYDGSAWNLSRQVTHPAFPGVNVTGTWVPVTNVGETTAFTATGNFTGTTQPYNPGMDPRSLFTAIVTFVPMTFDGTPQTPVAATFTSSELAGIAVTGGSWSPVTNVGQTTTYTPSSNFILDGFTARNPGMQPLDISAGYDFEGSFAEFTYTGLAQPPERTVTHNALTGNVPGTWSNVTDVGQTTTFTPIPSSGNFIGTVAGYDPEMQPFDISSNGYSFGGEFDEMTYNGLPQTPVRTVTHSALPALSNIPGTWSNVTNVADPTTFTPTAGNFTGSITVQNPGMARLDVSAGGVGSFVPLTYNGSLQTPSATVTASGLPATGTWSQVTNVGQTTAFTASGNFSGTITGRDPGMLQLNVYGATVGDFDQMTFDGDPQTPEATVTINGLPATGTWLPVTYVTDRTTFTASGNFTGYISNRVTGMNPLSVSGGTVGNFGLTYTGAAQTPTATVTVGDLPATGTWSQVTNVTDTSTFTASDNFTDTISDQVTGMNKATRAGAIAARRYVLFTDTSLRTYSLAGYVANYKLPADTLGYTVGDQTGGLAEVKFDIDPVTGVLSYSVVNGDSGQTATTTVTVGNFTNYEDITLNITITLTDKIPVNITGVTVSSRAWNGNPIVPNVSGLTVTPGDGGDAITDYTQPLIFIYTNIYTNVTSITAPTAAGSYELVISTNPNDPKYIGESDPIAFIISRVTQDAPTITYEQSGVWNAGGVTITITGPAAGASYSFDGGSTFGASNSYSFANGISNARIYVRLNETATHEQSPASVLTLVFSKYDQDAPAEFTLTYQANGSTNYTVTIPYLEGAEYSFNGTTWSSTNTITVLPRELVTGYRRFAETATHYAGPYTTDSLTLPPFRVQTPAASPNGGTFTYSQSVTLSTETPGADIYYTLDGTTPTSGSTPYIGEITLTATTTIRAIAVHAGMTDSTVMLVTFTRQEEQTTDAPMINGQAAGTDTISLTEGYTVQTRAYAITGDPTPVISVTGITGATITSAGVLTIPGGLAAGNYTVVITAGNGVSSDATMTVTVAVHTRDPVPTQTPGTVSDVTQHATIVLNGNFYDMHAASKNDAALTLSRSADGTTVYLSGYPGFTGNIGEAVSGSTSITIYNTFLQTLPNGTYTFTVSFIDYEGVIYASPQVTYVINRQNNPNNPPEIVVSNPPIIRNNPGGLPRTGVISNIVLWIILLLISIAVTISILVWHTRFKKKTGRQT